MQDYGHHAGVPPTALVSATAGAEVKIGSLQQFVKSESDCEERGVDQFPVDEVHKIAILDMRLGELRERWSAAEGHGGRSVVGQLERHAGMKASSSTRLSACRRSVGGTCG